VGKDSEDTLGKLLYPQKAHVRWKLGRGGQGTAASSHIKYN